MDGKPGEVPAAAGWKCRRDAWQLVQPDPDSAGSDDVRPRQPGQGKTALMAALSGPYLHPKLAIAVDEDIDAEGELEGSVDALVCGLDSQAKEGLAERVALDDAGVGGEGVGVASGVVVDV